MEPELGQGGGRQTGEGEAGMDGQHVREKRGERDGKRDHLKEDTVDKQSEVLDISADPVDERATGVGVEEPELEALELVIALGAQIDDEPTLEKLPKPNAVEVAQLETH
jgi:hypothetical protein